jgi:AraC-like DNA-binding protein
MKKHGIVQELPFLTNLRQYVIMSTEKYHSRPTLPGIYVTLLADVVMRWGINPEQLLDGSHIQPERLYEPFWYVDFYAFNNLLNKAVLLTNESALGVYLGVQMTVSCHGSVGMAAMVAKNLGEALGVMEQFIGLRCPALKPRLETQGEIAYLYLDQPMADFKMGIVGMTFLMVGFSQMCNAITGQRLAGWAELNFLQPSYFEHIKSILKNNIFFDQPYNRLVFPKQYLDLPLIMADPLAARLAREQCKHDLNMLAIKRGDKKQISNFVRELLYDEVQGLCKMAEVAEKLHVSERTLQRHLASESTTFQQLLDQVKEKQAKKLLSQLEHSIANISEQLGYADVTHFTRAFKRWTNETPKQYRVKRQ